VIVRDLGRIDYGDAMRVQDTLVEARLRGEVQDTLLLLEHPAVITLGRRGSFHDVRLPEAELTRRGIAVRVTTRGGLVTYHGPGQLVGYPIVHLRSLGLSVPAYVHALEAAIGQALGQVGIEAWTRPDHVGVWTARGKIAAIGIAQRHGVTLHGFAVNLQPDLSHFELIDACGIGGLGVTSARDILGHEIDITSFKDQVAEAVSRALMPARQSALA
jgi:lipoate-protein ligase B